MKKKYSSLRIASILLMLVLITSCVISGTFAKYTTSGSSSDSARVAKWGVVVHASGDDVGVLENAEGTNLEADVVTGLGKKIAPGTKGKICSFAIEGQPEVVVRIEYIATVTLEGWEVDGLFYCPVDIIVGNKTVEKGSSSSDYVTNIEDAIEMSYKVAAGSNLSGNDLNVTWKWDYSTDEAISLKDTALATKSTRPTIKIEVTCKVTQVD